MPKEMHRPAWAEIHLDCLATNLQIVKSKLKQDTKVMAVVKSDAYGHGAVVIAKHLLSCGVDQLAVVMVDEGIELRKAGIEAPILILGVTLPEQAEQVLHYDLTPMVCTLEFAQALNDVAEQNQKRAKIHLRIDIGLGSVGVKLEHTISFVQKLIHLEWLEIEGLFTHIASAYGENEQACRSDIEIFQQTVTRVENVLGYPIQTIHAASSPAIMHYPEAHYDLVRAGIVLYGLPATQRPLDVELQPVMQLKAKILYMKELEAGVGIGYGKTQILQRQTRLATVPLGYGDGLFLFYLMNGEVLVRGHRAPVYGQVFMDHFLIDVTDLPKVEIGDEVVIFGQQGEEIITATEVAVRAQIGLLNSDCVTLLSKRVPRVYFRKSKSKEESAQLIKV